jgi:hypothetical protein
LENNLRCHAGLDPASFTKYIFEKDSGARPERQDSVNNGFLFSSKISLPPFSLLLQKPGDYL